MNSHPLDFLVCSILDLKGMIDRNTFSSILTMDRSPSRHFPYEGRIVSTADCVITESQAVISLESSDEVDVTNSSSVAVVIAVVFIVIAVVFIVVAAVIVVG